MTHGLDDVVALFSTAGTWWAIGGGWAVDLHLGEPGRRAHKDVDLVCLNAEADRVRDHLDGWDLHRVRDGELEPWEDTLAPAHQAWARPDPDSAWAFEILFEAVEGDTWRFRRQPTVTLPLADLRSTAGGIPVVHLGVSLLYKAKRDDPTDRDDLRASLAVLHGDDRRWLREAVTATHGPEHPWVGLLAP